MWRPKKFSVSMLTVFVTFCLYQWLGRSRDLVDSIEDSDIDIAFANLDNLSWLDAVDDENQALSIQERNHLVFASLKADNTSWIYEHLQDWTKDIYVVDDNQAKLTIPLNKGRESMVYLTYLIDNYDQLPDRIVFLHSSRYQWHNDDPMYDSVAMIQRLQLPYITEAGYANLRCAWAVGCPVEITPLAEPSRAGTPSLRPQGVQYAKMESAFASAFMELFPGKDVPAAVGAGCCAQFATSKGKILERPREDYEFFRNWIVETELDDAISGRILEYVWHIIFGKAAVDCPDAATCYCTLYGLCNLNCSKDSCQGRYTLPLFSRMPKGWPNAEWL